MGRVRVDRRGRTRVRRRHHRLARRHDARDRHRGNGTFAGIAVSHRIGIDVGGTFTDLVLLAPDGSTVLEKTPTTPADQSEGVVAGLERLATAIGVASVGALLTRTESIVHGTTTADN